MIVTTLEDLPHDKKNCGNCTRRGGACARTQKQYPNGYIKNSSTGEIGGMIACCQHYTGPFANI